MTTKRHLKSLLTVSAAGLVAFSASGAMAQQQQGCPPGSWFCADAQVQPAAPAGQPVTPAPQALQPLPPQGQVQVQPQPPPAVVYQPAPAPPPVVVYQPAPPPVMIVRQPEYRGYYYRPVRQGPPYRNSEWGLNLHFDGAAIGSPKGDAGMGGLGAALRYKFTPYFGIETGIDFLAGRDYNDFRRNETGFSLGGLLFLNPRSRAQVYILGGVNWSIAKVTDDVSSPLYEQDYTYHYFGGQLGLGLEFRVSKVVAFNFDVRGVLRGRTDSNASSQPEFTDANGHTTNTSAGAIFTGGMTFYF